MSIVVRAVDERTRSLLQACVDGNLVSVLSYPVDDVRRARCRSGCGTLHYAAGSDRADIVEALTSEPFLIPADSVCDKKETKGRTPMHYSCRNGALETTKLLMRLGELDVLIFVCVLASLHFGERCGIVNLCT